MNSLCPGEENIYITDKYYLLLNEISEDFIKYINNYKSATNDYLKKIALNQEKYSPKLLDTKTQLKDVDSNHIKSLAAIIPKVVEQQIINIEFFVEGFDEKYNRFEKLIKDKSLEYLVIQNSFKDAKNELIKKYREIDKIKASFMTNINMVEDTIHKFYMKQNTNNKKKTNKLNFTQIDTGHDLNFISAEELINNSIQKTKRIEDEYKSNIISVKDLEKNYIEATENTKEKSREVISEIGNNLKEFISNCMLYLRNSFKIPLSEIDTYLNELVDTDEYTKIDRLIKSSYKKEISLKPINTEKYTLSLFKNFFNNKNNKINNLNISNNNNIKYIKNSIIEDELQEMDYEQEEGIFNTIKKMMENFDLLEKKNYDLELEEEKLRCKYLTLKILSFAPKSKLFSSKISKISPQEVEELDKFLQKKKNRVTFIQKLSQFRTRGIFEFPEKEYYILSRLFNNIVKIIEKEEDYECAVNIIILSQTYYIIKNNKKEYLQKEIMDNELFKSKKFWETFVNYSINKEIENSKKTDEKNGIKNNDKENEEKYSNIVFAQLVPITNNMIEFGLDINIVEEIILPIIKQYNIIPEFAEVVTSTINIKKVELGIK
jgi:hypothetical protein